MGSVVIDANVAIGFFDPTDEHHPRAVAAIEAMGSGDALLPSTAYSELLVHPTEKGVVEALDAALDELRVEVVPLDRTIARTAARLRAGRKSLSLGDAVVLATAMEAGAELLTFDGPLAKIAKGPR
jgi:predicted nucleic acid-binding protein